jgi:hypothetical protein
MTTYMEGRRSDESASSELPLYHDMGLLREVLPFAEVGIPEISDLNRIDRCLGVLRHATVGVWNR